MSKWLAFAVVVGGIVTGCGASGSGTAFDPGPSEGDGADAGAAPPPGTFEAGPPSCGDNTCNGGETCRTCARDCGECVTCGLAPSCTNALGIPSHPSPRSELFQGADPPDGGAPIATGGHEDCRDPELRLRIERVIPHKGAGEIYCIVDATDGTSSEVAITPKTKSLSNGEEAFFSPINSVFWGQKSLHATTNNLTITYNCFVVKSDAWAKVMGSAGDAANKAGGIAGPYGWAFGIGEVAANVAAAAIQAASGDTLIFNTQQTIDRAALLDLTNGRYWTIRKNGGGLFDKWDWQFDVQSWGCADGVEKAR
jgi:hypothetical protein